MCFEFEWLYWAQLAQEQERQRRQAARESTSDEHASAPQDRRPSQPQPQEAAHA